MPSAINFEVFSRLNLAKQLGEYTLILSNSPAFLVSAFAKYFGVDEWKATEYKTDRGHRLSQIQFILNGKEKAHYVRQTLEKKGIQHSVVSAYSDSFWDLPLLLAAGQPIAVNPDKKLRAFAQKLGWEII